MSLFLAVLLLLPVCAAAGPVVVTNGSHLYVAPLDCPGPVTWRARGSHAGSPLLTGRDAVSLGLTPVGRDARSAGRGLLFKVESAVHVWGACGEAPAEEDWRRARVTTVVPVPPAVTVLRLTRCSSVNLVHGAEGSAMTVEWRRDDDSWAGGTDGPLRLGPLMMTDSGGYAAWSILPNGTTLLLRAYRLVVAGEYRQDGRTTARPRVTTRHVSVTVPQAASLIMHPQHDPPRCGGPVTWVRARYRVGDPIYVWTRSPTGEQSRTFPGVFTAVSTLPDGTRVRLGRYNVSVDPLDPPVVPLTELVVAEFGEVSLRQQWHPTWPQSVTSDQGDLDEAPRTEPLSSDQRRFTWVYAGACSSVSIVGNLPLTLTGITQNFTATLTYGAPRGPKTTVARYSVTMRRPVDTPSEMSIAAGSELLLSTLTDEALGRWRYLAEGSRDPPVLISNTAYYWVASVTPALGGDYYGYELGPDSSEYLSMWYRLRVYDTPTEGIEGGATLTAGWTPWGLGKCVHTNPLGSSSVTTWACYLPTVGVMCTLGLLVCLALLVAAQCQGVVCRTWSGCRRAAVDSAAIQYVRL